MIPLYMYTNGSLSYCTLTTRIFVKLGNLMRDLFDYVSDTGFTSVFYGPFDVIAV